MKLYCDDHFTATDVINSLNNKKIKNKKNLKRNQCCFQSNYSSIISRVPLKISI